ncbi:OB-fold nucleic acid binding domain-containing protein, partial [Lachnotalea glycerini]
TYDCPQLEPILAPTYGCIVYQEQVMQIVRDLAGYTLGRSDLLRRAMSKKKASVMEKERQNFVYGNEAEGVKGCIANGIDEIIANKIYDNMIDFAKYAFNRSHAACYGVVAYQTAYLKHYYPVEFMAALMTSVLDNTSKVSEYILACRGMNISILPPDINEGEGDFSVSGNSIRYGLSAIKSIGRPVIDSIVTERNERGRFKDLRDFITRLSGKEVNKRTIESFIKAGALDSLGGTRRQLMMIYVQILEQISQDKKNAVVGQMTLFDMVSEEEKEQYEIKLPDVGEYDKETLLAFEKEVMGIYISGHPMEEYEDIWRKNVTAFTTDFLLDEETNMIQVDDGKTVVIGGMITGRTIKHTKNDKMMAFITIEDLVGSVEVVIFPRDYERNSSSIVVDNKVFVKGKVNAEDDRAGKVICEKIIPFESIDKEVWIKFQNKELFLADEEKLYDMIKESDGNDTIVIYIEDIKAIKRLSPSKNIKADKTIVSKLAKYFGENNVKVVEKNIENLTKMN